MSLKMKLTSTICAFMLILGLLIMGVFASPTATINLGGSISFKATDVHAQVDGTITGSKEALADTTDSEDNLETLNFNNNTNVETEGAKWSNHNISFQDNGSTVTILIKITNLASDRVLYASVNDSIGTVDNVTKTMKRVTSPTDANPTDYDGTLFEIPAKPETGTDNVAYVQLTMTVTDPNASLPEGAAYGYVIELKDPSSLNVNNIENLSFTVTDEANKEVSVSMKSLEETRGEIVIPSYVIIDETTGQATMASANSTSSNLYKVTSIGDKAFVDMVKGQEISQYWQQHGTLPDGTEVTESELNEVFFDLCVAQITSIKIPKTMKQISKNSFAFTSPVLKRVIYEEVNEETTCEIFFTEYALAPSLQEKVYDKTCELQVVIENGFVSSRAFYKENNADYFYLGNLILGNNVDIGAGAFLSTPECRVSMFSVTIGNSNIGNSTFKNEYNLMRVVMSKNVTSIGKDAFNNCNSLTDVYYMGSEEDWLKIAIDEGNECLTGATMHYNYNPNEEA